MFVFFLSLDDSIAQPKNVMITFVLEGGAGA